MSETLKKVPEVSVSASTTGRFVEAFDLVIEGRGAVEVHAMSVSINPNPEFPFSEGGFSYGVAEPVPLLDNVWQRVWRREKQAPNAPERFIIHFRTGEGQTIFYRVNFL